MSTQLVEEEVSFIDVPDVPFEAPSGPREISIPVQIDHMLISDITRLRSPDDLRDMFSDFERQVENHITPLKILLNKVILSQEVQQIEAHSAQVDKWRNIVTRYYSLAMAFVEHGKSSHFLADYHGNFNKLTDGVRDAYRRSLTAGYQAFAIRLEGLIADIDSRVNLVKKYSDGEKIGFRNHGGRY